MARSWLVVWCAASWLAAAEHIGPERPQCPSDVGERCQQNDFSTDEFFYKINGKYDHQNVFITWLHYIQTNN
jgi:hypothetical protein